MSDRLPWFRCFPSALLGAMAGLSADEGLVYLTTLLRIYEVGGPVRETGRTLSRRTGLTERRADAALAELVRLGKVERHADGYVDSHSTHAEIEWQLDRRDDQSTAGKASAARRQKQAVDKKNGASVEADDKNEGQKAQQNQRNGSTAVEQPFNHLEEDTDTVQKKAAPSPEQRARESFPPNAFETWWGRYPHKVGKGAAERSFDRVRKSGRASYPDLMNGVERYIAGKPIDRAWCNPATWLNQARWLDEHSPAPPGPHPGTRAGQPQQRKSANPYLDMAFGDLGGSSERSSDQFGPLLRIAAGSAH